MWSEVAFAELESQLPANRVLLHQVQLQGSAIVPEGGEAALPIEARVQAQDAELAVRSQELKLRTDLGSALLNLQTAYGVAQLQEQVVDRATEELRLAQERFRFGVASSVEVTDAQTSLAEAEQARIDALRARAFVGTGAQVLERLSALAESLDIEEVVVITWTWDPQAQRRSYELLAQACGLQAAG